uniref:Uncharacterized protein n=1 Tax=Arundo donax TaxID=35708 RepID=A0A0A9DAS0_ARUDO
MGWFLALLSCFQKDQLMPSLKQQHPWLSCHRVQWHCVSQNCQGGFVFLHQLNLTA